MPAFWNFAAGLAAHLLVPPAMQRPQRSRDSRARIGLAQAPNGALSSAANDAHTGRSRPQFAWNPPDSGMGRGTKPVINVNWDDARQYVTWFSRMTCKTYRLLTEAEFEYAARAGTQTIYSWGDEIGHGNANCAGCGSEWDNLETSPAGSFKPNAFGLYDMHGNVWEWAEDCFHLEYNGAPQDGSAWIAYGACRSHVVRGGSWANNPLRLRAAARDRFITDTRYGNLMGFRVGRTLTP